MKLQVDIAAAAERAAALPAELESLEDVPAGLRDLYAERDGRHVLDVEKQHSLVCDLKRLDASTKLDAAKEQFEDDKRRRIAVAIIRRNLAHQGVGEKHLDVLTLAFLASHRLALQQRAEGKHDLRVLGPRGADAEAIEIAAVRWVEDEAASFTGRGMEAAETSDTGFAAQLRRGLHLVTP